MQAIIENFWRETNVPLKNFIKQRVPNEYDTEDIYWVPSTDTYCRTIIYECNEYEDIPAKAIRQAALKVLGLAEKQQRHRDPYGQAGFIKLNPRTGLVKSRN